MAVRNFSKTAVLLVFLLGLTSCLDKLSWSPDGRYLAFAGDEDGMFRLWDNGLRRWKTISVGIKEPIKGCHYLFAENRILLLAGGNDNSADLYRYDFNTSDGACSKIAGNVSLYIESSRLGDVFYTANNSDTHTYGLWRHRGG